MDARSIRSAVARLFRPQLPGSTRTVRVAVEQELFAMGLFSGGSVAPARVREATAGRWYAPWLSFEPGGQVELSLPSAPSPDAAARHLAEVTDALGRDLQPHSIVLDARPVRRCEPATPRRLRTPRYDAMERHLDAVGPAGRRMMRSTASTQACLDWWPGSAGVEQWRVLLLAGPFLAAATARSTGPDGRLTTWLSVDPGRTAFDDRLLHGEDPVTAYASFAAGATDFLGAGVEAHLSTLFPPVRPRGRYLEVRFPDARPAREVADLLHGLARLLYDDEHRRAALASLSGERDRLAEHWADAAAGTCDAGRGLALLAGSTRRAAA
ncbi:glutamate-cysteine ligase family protein [Nocardioides kongjuensis]|uniref:glutamate--cysteine ligase n=1 Tax=Nocardioides kongjuensis TaxID=349522 RepID=A0A852RDE2_9ACTN|nr:glutamate-cysteine ligase family protein [Nocardioides kongjuensis]NYD33033.1 glutamate--cysteine ligase [Nocardioides kongjuensis]